MRTNGNPKRLVGAQMLDLEQVPLAGSVIDEAKLQHWMDRHPDLLPIDAIGSSWGPLISLGREIQTGAGPLDNLFVSPRGDLTVVEAKLWRNPQARREVVGQVLHYAAALSKMSFDDLDRRVKSASDARLGIWDRVMASREAPPESMQASFMDAVGRCLRTGAFLLLIVGDGIRHGLGDISDLLVGHPALRFHLVLVELGLFREVDAPDDELFIVPSIVGESSEVVRAIVEVRNDATGAVNVEVAAVEEPIEDGPARRLSSLEEFVERATEVIGAADADGLRTIIDWWVTDVRQPIEFNQSSVSLRGRHPNPSKPPVSVMNIGADGRLMASVRPMVNAGILEQGVADDFFTKAGWSCSPSWPSRWIRPSEKGDREHALGVLRWIAGHVTA